MSEKSSAAAGTPSKEFKIEEVTSPRAVAFPDEHGDVHDERLTGGMRPKGIEMKRELTKEDRELAAAGYEHLEEGKTKKGAQKEALTHMDIQDHRLPFAELRTTLQTSFDTKDAAKSRGLTSQEAAARLARDGQNVLTPPKKRSALLKVRRRPPPLDVQIS
jgi:sodium/potassium-transporting ATPase subunit alpha